ncbi:MAG: hypothetical protein A2Y79_05490 [Deltaproteobacteria bacterium RBG_13_43_22]|nr:MAG: hypothetical protein A2Y79_05490 [Deltaproteobacteria bacterium RBG_13_43_22]
MAEGCCFPLAYHRGKSCHRRDRECGGGKASPADKSEKNQPGSLRQKKIPGESRLSRTHE